MMDNATICVGDFVKLVTDKHMPNEISLTNSNGVNNDTNGFVGKMRRGELAIVLAKVTTNLDTKFSFDEIMVMVCGSSEMGWWNLLSFEKVNV